MRDGLGRGDAQQPQLGFGMGIVCVVVALVGWCAAGASESVPSRAKATASDGLTIAYDVRGSGETALVFVHCWACDRAFWREQLDAFASDYLVVSLDLGGHGESGTDREAWTIEGLAGDVIAVADALSLDSMILVGHSMGGPVSLYAARSLGDRVRGVILLDTLHDVEAEVPDEAIEQFAQSFEDDFTGTMAGATQPRFSDADSDAARWVVERACAAHPEVVVALMRDFVGFDPVPLVAGVSVPIRGINAAPTAEGGQATAVETNRKHCDFDAVLVEGVGHFLQLEKPHEVNRHLRAFVQEMVGVTGAPDVVRLKQAEVTFIRTVPPDYPASAKRDGVTGEVVLQVRFDLDGKPSQIEILEGPDVFAPPATEAVLLWRARPWLDEFGVVKEFDVTIRLRFSLD